MLKRLDERIRIAVLFGGRSPEHSISCVSAGNVLRALDRDRYEVIPIRITRSGAWTLASSDYSISSCELRQGLGANEDMTELRGLMLSGNRIISLDSDGHSLELAVVDVVFPLLHGPYGEDGTIQGLLELAGVPYVGSGVLASAVCMDKDFSKRLLRDRGLPVGEYVVMPSGQELSGAERKRIGLPAFVKPARSGSSLGITRITGWAQLAGAVESAKQFDHKVLLEAAIAGRELACGVLEGEAGGDPEVSRACLLLCVRRV